MGKTNKKDFEDNSIILSMQQDRQNKSKMELDQILSDIDDIENTGKKNDSDLDDLLAMASGIDTDSVNNNVSIDILGEIEDVLFENKDIPTENSGDNSKIDSYTYEDLLKSATIYNSDNGIDNNNAYKSMMSDYERSQLSSKFVQEFNLSTLTKLDYAFATLSGIISGLIDVLFVGTIGAPKAGGLQSQTDQVFKKLVRGYAKINGWKGANSGSDPTASAIGFLERTNKVGYDAPNSSYLAKQSGKEVIKGMTPKNHHAESLAHSFTPLGLIMGVWDLMHGTSSVVSPTDGTWKTYVVDNPMNAKDAIFKAVPEWIGHCMSDISGASGSVGHGNRGQGLPSPLHDIFRQMNFGSIRYNGSEERLNVAQISEKMFEKGYDFRAFTAQAIPVIFNEVLVRCYWIIRQHFYYGKSWQDSIPFAKDRDFGNMIFTATATFSAIDIGDAIIKGGADAAAGNPLTLLMTLNYPGLVDFGFRSVRKVRNDVEHVKDMTNKNNDIQAEWDRVLGTF